MSKLTKSFMETSAALGIDTTGVVRRQEELKDKKVSMLTIEETHFITRYLELEEKLETVKSLNITLSLEQSQQFIRELDEVYPAPPKSEITQSTIGKVMLDVTLGVSHVFAKDIKEKNVEDLTLSEARMMLQLALYDYEEAAI